MIRPIPYVSKLADRKVHGVQVIPCFCCVRTAAWTSNQIARAEAVKKQEVSFTHRYFLNASSIILDRALDVPYLDKWSSQLKLFLQFDFSPDALLNWLRKQLASYDCLAVNDMTYSFQDGLALCAIIHR